MLSLSLALKTSKVTELRCEYFLDGANIEWIVLRTLIYFSKIFFQFIIYKTKTGTETNRLYCELAAKNLVQQYHRRT